MDKQKKLWLDRFKKTDSAWQDGDQSGHDKTSDLVHPKNKIAIELKIDKTYSAPINCSQSNILNTISNRYKGNAKSANKKFANYPDHRTILLIETSLRQDVFDFVWKGLMKIQIPTGQKITKNKYLSGNTENIGIYVVSSFSDNRIGLYINPYAAPTRIMTNPELVGILTSIGIPVDKIV